jgi:radical SAM protein with 4Fe4S-binding SPASM domain
MDCSALPTVTLEDFLGRLRAGAGGRRLALSGTLELTERCNLGCTHCYIRRPARDRAAAAVELDTRHWRDLIDQMVDEGCLWLLLTGGEPLLRADLAELCRHAVRRGVFVTLFTNGTLLTERTVDLLAESPPRAVELTLYGRSEQTYERVTGVPGSFARCMAGIELLLERGLPLKLKTLLTTQNRHELPAMRELAASLGVDFRFDPELNLRIDGGREPASLRLTPEEVVSHDLEDPRRMAEWRALYERCHDRVEDDPRLLFDCGAGIASFHVDACGQLAVCAMFREPSYDLETGSFADGWHHFIPGVLGRPWTVNSDCRVCALRPVCSWCPGWAQVEHGDPEAPVDYLCDITKRRALLVEEVGGRGERA